jgi:hypothetical protein
MGMNPYCTGMNNNGFLLFDGMTTGFGHGIHRIKNIFAIAVNNPQVFKTPEIIGRPPVGSLVAFMN